MSIRKWLGLLIGFSGIVLVLINDQSPQEAGKSAFLFISWPEISILIAVISTVYGWVVFKKLIKVGGYSSLMINGFGMLSAGILAFLTSFIMEGSCCSNSKGFFAMSTTDLFASFGYTLLLIILTNIIGYNLYGYLLKKYSVTFLSFAGTLTPFFAAFFGNVFLGEVPTVTFFVSSVIVVIGLYIFYIDDKRENKKIHEKIEEKMAELLPIDE
jgi:EamA-like transporter family.